jgi:hypothetical protein
MTATLFGREPSQVKGAALIWRGRGWRVDVYPVGAKWRWHVCVSHSRVVVVDHVSEFEHPSARAATRSASAAIRAIGRAVSLMQGGA